MAMQEPSTSSGLITVSTTVIVGAPALLSSLILNPAAADCSVIIYDNATAASGTVLAKLLAVAATTSGSVSVSFNSPIYSTRGLTMIVAGTGATATCSFTKAY